MNHKGKFDRLLLIEFAEQSRAPPILKVGEKGNEKSWRFSFFFLNLSGFYN